MRFRDWLLQPVRDDIEHLARYVSIRTSTLMTALDDLKSSVSDLGNALQAKLSSDAQKIDDLTAKLAALPALGGTSDADVEAVVSQIKALTAGLAPAAQPVVDAAQAVPSVAPAPPSAN